jgi:shikimate dehydrogenase
MKATAPAPDCLAALAPAGADRRCAGLIGRAIQESLTPGMHEAEGRRLGLAYDYRLLDFDRLGLDDAALGAVLQLAGERGFAGLNVTHPFKQAVLPLLDALWPDAEAIGAVNTVVFQAGRAIGHNTDCWGFAESFRRGMAGAGLDRVVLVGAGGAGLAVARALVDLGAREVMVFDREAPRAQRLAQRLQGGGTTFIARPLDRLAAALAGAEGLINATPAGMRKYPGLPVPAEALHGALWVADIVYFPLRTALVEAAAARGCRTLTGRGMAVFQAVRAFALFTGRAPDAEAMVLHFDRLQSASGRPEAASA